MNEPLMIRYALAYLGEIPSFEFIEPALEWVGAVTNQPPIGEPTEQERELMFSEPSSVVGVVTYNPDLQNMTVELNGKIYNFCNVPQRKFEAFKGASSKGAFFSRNVKGQHNC